MEGIIVAGDLTLGEFMPESELGIGVVAGKFTGNGTAYRSVLTTLRQRDEGTEDRQQEHPRQAAAWSDPEFGDGLVRTQ
jgi:hypothetical protein